MTIEDPGALVAMARRRQSKAVELLMGMVTGMVADDHLHDREILFLRTWLTENVEVASTWPGCVIAERVSHVLADGVITEDERQHLLGTLKDMAAADFDAGSSSQEVLRLPLQTDVDVDVRGRAVCHTGVFLYGTRSKCEALTEAAGGIPVPSISRKVAYLVVGTNVSPDWAQTSYGRKIEAAMDLRRDGHSIAIIPERLWLQALGAA